MLHKINESLKQQLDKAKGLADTASNKMSDMKDAGLDKMNELKEAGLDKIKSGMDELSNGLPLIEKAGFKVNDISIGLGIPPDIAISFKKTNQVDDQAIQELINSNEDKKILTTILNALLAANKIQSKMTMDKFTFSGVSLKMGLPPQVNLYYKEVS